jgi:hypothetical protein
MVLRGFVVMYNTTSSHWILWFGCGFVVCGYGARSAQISANFGDIVVRLWLRKYISKAITMVIRNPATRG